MPNKKFKRTLALGVLRLMGWRLTGTRPELKRFIVLGAPHTSNWDFFFSVLTGWGYELDFRWLGKKELFRFPLGIFLEALGGIPVNRSRSTNLVDSMVQIFKSRDECIILIPPEGTRQPVDQWKKGFYHTAVGAGIPFVLGYIDYAKKETGCGPVIFPTGDMERDLRPAYKFYEGITAKYPENYRSPRSGNRNHEC